MNRHIRILAALIGLGIPGFSVAQPQAIQPEVYEALRYRYIGPVGNRLIAVAGLPGDPKVYYAGAASGGIFKTTDGGATWSSIFDDQPASSIGALAIAPSDPNVVWAGTGETFIRSNISIGNGIYKSTDAGKSWAHVGLESTGRIGRIVIDPEDPDVVVACALGHAYGPQPERGVFRTADGGKSWTKTLFVDENTGCSDVAMDPNNPRILFAGMWQVELHTFGRTSGGAGSGLFRSTDGGVIWTRLEGHGLPTPPVGKISVAVAPSRSRRVYALIETGDGVPEEGRETESGSLWRSDDGGDNWRLVSRDRQLRGRTHYYTRHIIEPDDEDEVYFLSAFVTKTLDGGGSIVDLNEDKTPGGDAHDMWIDPVDGDRMIVAHDDGISISLNRGESWLRLQLPVAQMYHVAVDDQIPYYVYGNRQDGPSTRGPSHSRLAPAYLNESLPGPIPRGMWRSVGGSESGWAIPDPVDPNIVWSSGTGYGSIGGAVDRFDLRTNQARRVEVWPDATIGWPAADLKFRFNWTFPVSISPHDHETVYVGSQFVHRTTNGGASWDVISPDLTLNDKERQQISGGLTPDNIGVEYAGVVFAIAESTLERGLIWAGTNDGQVQVTRNGGESWENVTAGIPGLPPWGTVSNIEPSRFDAGAAYITVDLHQMNNRDPFVYKTTDYGKTWRSVSSNIPKSVFSYAHCVREDPVREGMLYVGTENGVYVSLDDGGSWLPLQSGLPHAPAHWLVVQERFNDLVVATYGRGFWILDDITPLRQLTPDVLSSATTHLFAPRAAYRFRPVSEPMWAWNDATLGHNPPEGALLHYFLKSVPEGDVTISIVDASGKTVRTFDGTKQAGINRVRWDLRNETTSEIRLRTSPPYAPEIGVGPDGYRPFPLGGRLAVLAPPGTYTVKLSVGDEVLTESLTLLKDPNTEGSDSDIREQTALMEAIQSDLEQAAGAINEIERVRAQLQSLATVLGEDEPLASIRTAAEALDDELMGVEEGLFQVKVTGRGQDQLRWPAQIVQKLLYLADGVSLSDFAPTKEQRDVERQIRERIATLRNRLDEVVANDVAGFNEMLRQQNVGNIVVPRQLKNY